MFLLPQLNRTSCPFPQWARSRCNPYYIRGNGASTTTNTNKTDNSTANGIANRTVIPRKTRSIDMSLYWVINRVTQKQFIIYWKPGNDNLADYFSKHHPPTHHKHMRYEYVQDSPVT